MLGQLVQSQELHGTYVTRFVNGFGEIGFPIRFVLVSSSSSSIKVDMIKIYFCKSENYIINVLGSAAGSEAASLNLTSFDVISITSWLASLTMIN